MGELAGDGRTVPLSTLQRLRLAYEKRGVWGLVDQRAARRPGARTDERVLQAIGQAVAEETNRSTGTVARLRRRVEQILTDDGVDPASVMPARATFYRLAERISAGKHTFGSRRPVRRPRPARHPSCPTTPLPPRPTPRPPGNRRRVRRSSPHHRPLGAARAPR